ncbi:hypothetical protein TrVE_jg1010 [Triparma verrucosa]|uniref:HIG1 domain-containing protein n=2 Tax=Triparma TaxID=722752 RepID=A0A9W7BQY1_9STRA|nr:hypothetical protein TrST_g9788 [Triparma strigata]GMH98412.1 hypothetical protein TrVE_jg1010 [Triparma verrucosa]
MASEDRPRAESSWDKFVRKSTDQPLVPIGSLITLGFLTSGLKSFVDGKAMRSQQMMRGRVLAQGVTVVAILGYAAANGFKQEKKILTTAERDAAVLAPGRK